MLLEKDGVVYDLADKTQIEAFKNAGYKVVEEKPLEKSGVKKLVGKPILKE